MSLNSMKARINYNGGIKQQDRMNLDKLRSLKKALWYSYQAATAVLADGREFRCLINSDKLNMDVDNKIISIPFKGVRLNKETSNIPNPPSSGEDTNSGGGSGDNEGTWEDMEDLISVLTLAVSEGTWEDMGDPDDPIDPDEPIEPTPPIEPIPPIDNEEEEVSIKEGDIITWKENNSHWLIYLRRLEETAYFRGDMRRCRHQITLGNGSKYWVYLRGPVEKTISWHEKSNNYFNKLNYTLLLYLPQTEETEKYFCRFKKIMINNKPWEVQTVDNISTPGILELSLKETYSNTVQDNLEEAVKKAEQKEEFIEQDNIYIQGSTTIYPYDVRYYEIKNYDSNIGIWKVKDESRKGIVKVLQLGTTAEIHVLTGKSGSFTLSFENENEAIAALDITIGSL
jgi:hypothetical protein